MNKEHIWEEIHKNRNWGRYPNEELVKFIGRNFFKLELNDRKNLKILEIGCGQGANIWFLVKEGFDTFGIDISKTAIEKANQFLASFHQLSANLQQGDAKKLPFEDNLFDVVLDIDALQHLTFEEHKQAYDEINRVLKTDGLFWSMHVSKESSSYGSGEKIDHDTFINILEGPFAGAGQITMIDKQDMRTLLEERNLKVIYLEKQINTYNNLNGSLVHWIVVSKKN